MQKMPSDLSILKCLEISPMIYEIRFINSYDIRFYSKDFFAEIRLMNFMVNEEMVANECILMPF